jgi:uncharacterized sporulation protein YeaH/YhbH (DUF444 family)
VQSTACGRAFFMAMKIFLSKRQENVSIRYLAQVHSGVFDEKRLG